MEPHKTFIVGAGGLGREVAAMLLNAGVLTQNLAFIDDSIPKGSKVNNLDVWGSLADLKKIKDLINIYVALGNPNTRQTVVDQIQKMNLPSIEFPNLFHPSSIIEQAEFVHFGKGNILCQGTILSTNIELGSFNIINRASTLSHDTCIGNYTTLMPGVHISGGARIGNTVYIGTGSVFPKYVEIRDSERIETSPPPFGIPICKIQ